MKFKGKIEEPKKTFSGRNVLKINGIHLAGDLLDIHVTASYPIGTTIDFILKAIIDKYASTFTYANVASFSTITTPINWSEKPFWECVIDLCEIANADCYVDKATASDTVCKDFHMFTRGSIECELDAAVFEDNLLDMQGLGEDTVEVKNNIRVIGEDNEGLPILATANDDTTTLNVKEKIIQDTSINTMEEAQKRADAELAISKVPDVKGSVSCLLLPYVNPGEKMYITVPTHDILDLFRVINLTYKFDISGLITTDVDVAKVTKGIPQFFRDRMSKELGLEKINNPNRMSFSYNFTFDDNTNIDSHSGTETTGGALKLTTGSSTGTMTTSSKTASSTVSQVEIKIVGSNLDISTFEVSANGGLNYTTVTKDVLKALSVSGTNLKIRVNLISNTANPNPSVESLVCLF